MPRWNWRDGPKVIVKTRGLLRHVVAKAIVYGVISQTERRDLCGRDGEDSGTPWDKRISHLSERLDMARAGGPPRPDFASLPSSLDTQPYTGELVVPGACRMFSTRYISRLSGAWRNAREVARRRPRGNV